MLYILVLAGVVPGLFLSKKITFFATFFQKYLRRITLCVTFTSVKKQRKT